MQTNPGNICINCSQILECGNWEKEHYNSVLEIRRPVCFISGNISVEPKHLYCILTALHFQKMLPPYLFLWNSFLNFKYLFLTLFRGPKLAILCEKTLFLKFVMAFRFVMTSSTNEKRTLNKIDKWQRSLWGVFQKGSSGLINNFIKATI